MLAVSKNREAGFSLVELVIALGLAGLVSAAAFTALISVIRQGRAGASQVQFTSMGRIATQKIARYVEQGRFVGLTSNGVNIISLDFDVNRIYFRDIDGDPDTVEDNQLVYDRDVATAGGVKAICTHVRPIAGEDMFLVVDSTATARFNFHVGDGTNTAAASFSGTGFGYQGIEIRTSATPRNEQRWYD